MPSASELLQPAALLLSSSAMLRNNVLSLLKTLGQHQTPHPTYLLEAPVNYSSSWQTSSVRGQIVKVLGSLWVTRYLLQLFSFAMESESSHRWYVND